MRLTRQSAKSVSLVPTSDSIRNRVCRRTHAGRCGRRLDLARCPMLASPAVPVHDLIEWPAVGLAKWPQWPARGVAQADEVNSQVAVGESKYPLLLLWFDDRR